MGLLWTTVKNETVNRSPERIFHEEKRAPTDESIRLAREYEEKAHAEISEKLLVKNNMFTYSLAFSQNDILASPRFHIKIRINDIDFSETFYLNSFDALQPEYVCKIISEWLASKILMKPINDIFHSYMSSGMGYKNINIGQ